MGYVGWLPINQSAWKRQLPERLGALDKTFFGKLNKQNIFWRFLLCLSKVFSEVTWRVEIPDTLISYPIVPSRPGHQYVYFEGPMVEWRVASHCCSHLIQMTSWNLEEMLIQSHNNSTSKWTAIFLVKRFSTSKSPDLIVTRLAKLIWLTLTLTFLIDFCAAE